MDLSHVAGERLQNQRLTHTDLKQPEDVVAWLGAVQAQEYALAKWALGLRLPGATDAEIEQALTDGRILRTHVLRPTWHFVTPADIRWLLALTGPRVHAVNASMCRKLELDATVFGRSNTIIATALEGGRQLTRTELGAVLAEGGIVAAGQRLAYLVMHAELDGIVCSGPRRGKQFTYALLDERAPHSTTLDRDEALAELTTRFFTSHGPATIQDFAWWSGLTQADAKTGLELAKPAVTHDVIDGKTYWRAAATPKGTPSPSPTAWLLPPFDEYTIAYKNYFPILDPLFAQQAREALYGGAMIIDGQLIGYWRRTLNTGAAVVALEPFRLLSTTEHAAFAAAAARYSAFLQMPVMLADSDHAASP